MQCLFAHTLRRFPLREWTIEQKWMSILLPLLLLYNGKLNEDFVHYGYFDIAYRDSCSNFEELLTKANSVTIHHKNLQLLATEIFKTQRNLIPSFMNQIFVEKDTPYTLRSGRNILAPQPIRQGMVLKMHVFLERRYGIQESHALYSFKRDIKKYKFECNCRLCKRFIQNLGFL